jgi:hypothetical protein
LSCYLAAVPTSKGPGICESWGHSGSSVVYFERSFDKDEAEGESEGLDYVVDLELEDGFVCAV